MSMNTSPPRPISSTSPRRPPAPPGASSVSPSQPKHSFARKLSDRVDAAVAGLFALGDRLQAVEHAEVVFEMAEVVASARQPELVESALVRLAARMGGANRVELWLDHDDQFRPEPKLVALWTDQEAPMTEEEIEAMGYPLTLGLWCGEHYQMSLQLYARSIKVKKRWSEGMVRRLGALCAVAAAAERGLHVSQRGRIETQAKTKALVRDATFLNAMLPYAMAQAHRHREPLTLICVELDRIGHLYRAHGPGVATKAVDRVAESVAKVLRGSDVVTRLDDDRLIVVIPNAGGPDSLVVAEKIRHAVLRSSHPSPLAISLTASVGVACYPIDADDMLPLLHAADEAMAQAKARGGDQIAACPPKRPIGLHLTREIDGQDWGQRVG